MLNEVLEQTGRLFVDASKGNVNNATAHGIRLKQIVPGATRGFHEALDELESELFIAKAVMRRDLVRLRTQQPSQTDDVKSIDTATAKDDKPDVDMTDAEDVEPAISTETENVAAFSKPEEASTAEVPVTETNDVRDEDQISTPLAQNAVTEPQDLHIDTSQPTQQSAPIVASADPDTAGTQNIDFDSLFNDSDNTTTNGDSKSQTPKPVEDVSTVDEQHGNQQEPDFSFESFNEQNPTDNDGKQEDMSSILPGLESYANAEGADLQMTDFPSIESQQQKTGDTQDQSHQNLDQSQTQQEGEHRDTTFDDIMNFGDFDLGSLGSGDNNFGGEEDDNRFDDNFFNVE